MTFTEICGRLPRLEYLFGCFMQRYWQVAQVDPNRVLREFARRNHHDVEETLHQLIFLIAHFGEGPQADDRAREFLEILDCPYDPLYYGRPALSWLKHVQKVLADTQKPRVLVFRRSEPEPLATYSPITAPLLPLNLVSVFLNPYQPLGMHGARDSISIPLASWTMELIEAQPLNTPPREPLLTPVPLSNGIIPLADVRPV